MKKKFKLFILFRKIIIPIFLFLLIFLPQVRLAYAQQSYYLKGTVTNNTSRPVPRVWVILYQNNREARRTLTGNDGKYYIGRLNTGRYSIRIKRNLYQSSIPISDSLLNFRTNTTRNIKLR